MEKKLFICFLCTMTIHITSAFPLLQALRYYQRNQPIVNSDSNIFNLKEDKSPYLSSVSHTTSDVVINKEDVIKAFRVIQMLLLQYQMDIKSNRRTQRHRRKQRRRRYRRNNDPISVTGSFGGFNGQSANAPDRLTRILEQIRAEEAARNRQVVIPDGMENILSHLANRINRQVR